MEKNRASYKTRQSNLILEKLPGTLTELTERTSLRKSTVVSVLRRLERVGIVRIFSLVYHKVGDYVPRKVTQKDRILSFLRRNGLSTKKQLELEFDSDLVGRDLRILLHERKIIAKAQEVTKRFKGSYRKRVVIFYSINEDK